MKKVIISPPFGNYIQRDWATSVYGTYTFNRRRGLWWKVLTTLRKTESGWSNNIGLRNKGLKNIKAGKLAKQAGEIVSIAGMTGQEWMQIIKHLARFDPECVELNVSCPNAPRCADINVLWLAVREFRNICVKVAPTAEGRTAIGEAYRAGVRTFHIGNTFPSLDGGGESGGIARYHSLEVIDWARSKYSDLTIIGGGGIYTPQDVRDYRDAGVNHYSLSTIWFTPWKVKAVKEEIYATDGSTT